MVAVAARETATARALLSSGASTRVRNEAARNAEEIARELGDTTLAAELAGR
jgi:hypothetical protein